MKFLILCVFVCGYISVRIYVVKGQLVEVNFHLSLCEYLELL